MLVDRTQPHPKQHGVHHRGCDRLPQRERHDPAGERDAAGDPGRARLEHLHGGQVAPVSRGRDESRVNATQLADGPRLRTLLRLLGRGNEPVVPGPRVRQPSRRSAEVSGGGLPLHRRHHRQGDRVHQRCEGDRSGKAVLPVLRARRLSRAASRAEGVDRPVQGPFRRGLRGHAGADAGPPEGTRHRAARHRAPGRQSAGYRGDAHGTRQQAVPRFGRDAAVGVVGRRREAALLAHGGGVRGVPVSRRSSHRSAPRLPRSDRAARQHAHLRRLRQRCER